MFFIKLENDRGVATTFEITQYTTQYGDPDEIDSPRDSFWLTIWRNADHSEDYVLIGRKTYLQNFSKIGTMTDGPWSAFYIMNNNGKTIDSFRIPELWRNEPSIKGVYQPTDELDDNDPPTEDSETATI